MKSTNELCVLDRSQRIFLFQKQNICFSCWCLTLWTKRRNAFVIIFVHWRPKIEKKKKEYKKDGPGPVMVSSTLCPAVHILGSQNVYGRAEGIADHYWPWAVFYCLLLCLPVSLSLAFSFCLSYPAKDGAAVIDGIQLPKLIKSIAVINRLCEEFRMKDLTSEHYFQTCTRGLSNLFLRKSAIFLAQFFQKLWRNEHNIYE